jgi:hypothetical protein
MLIPNTFCYAGGLCVSQIFSMYSPPPYPGSVCLVGLEEADLCFRLDPLTQASEAAQKSGTLDKRLGMKFGTRIIR